MDAFAQFALLSFVPFQKAQTNNIMKPTSGIETIKKVKIHSPVFTDT